MTKQLVEITVPDIGNYSDVEVIEVAVQPGDTVALEGTLITLETEKATVDIPSTVAGVVREMKLQRGSRVSQGDVIAVVEAEAEGDAAKGAGTQAQVDTATKPAAAPVAPAAAPEPAEAAAKPAAAKSAPPEDSQRSPDAPTQSAPAPAAPCIASRDGCTASTSRVSRVRMRARRSANSRANWVST